LRGELSPLSLKWQLTSTIWIRVLTQRFRNSAEYSLEDVPLDQFIAALVATDHFLVYTQSYEEDGIYLIAPSILRDREPIIRRILTEAFHVNEVVTDDGIRVATTEYVHDDLEREVGAYLLVLAPCSQFLWNGLVLILQIPKIDFDLKDNRVRLIADGPQRRLASAKQCFDELFVDEEGMPFSPGLQPLVCLTEQQAHIPSVNRELRKFARATNRLAEAIVDSVHHVRSSLETVSGCQELMQNWFLFASEHGQHAQKHMDRVGQHKLNSLLIGLAISWVSFICDDCDPNDRRTFKWAVSALEYTFHRTRRNFILQVPDDQFEMLRSKVSNCMTVLMGHFDILGARDTEAKKRREQLEEALRQQALDNGMNHDQFSGDYPPDQEEALLNLGPYMHTDASTRVYWDKVKRSLDEVEKQRTAVGATQRMLGRVLDDEKLEDRSLVFLANSSSNISIRWQQGRFIGAGAFGSVYLAVNLDSGSLMAVKEIKFQDLSGLPNLYTQIKDELSVMEMLHHPNVVEYYGIEVHRDKVYIFEEYCQGGSLAALLEHGRIEDEGIIQVYTMQMLEGLAYLHSKGIVHRDVKPDSAHIIFDPFQFLNHRSRHPPRSYGGYQIRRFRCGQDPGQEPALNETIASLAWRT
jgi:mitogen-activated protein kinase kinase kinase